MYKLFKEFKAQLRWFDWVTGHKKMYTWSEGDGISFRRGNALFGFLKVSFALAIIIALLW